MEKKKKQNGGPELEYMQANVPQEMRIAMTCVRFYCAPVLVLVSSVVSEVCLPTRTCPQNNAHTHVPVHSKQKQSISRSVGPKWGQHLHRKITNAIKKLTH